jgi:hypothetical protein
MRKSYELKTYTEFGILAMFSVYVLFTPELKWNEAKIKFLLLS